MGEEEDSWEVPFGELAKFSVERSSSGFYWATSEGKILNTNKALREKLGYSEDELKEMYVWDIDPNHIKENRKESWIKLKKEKTCTFQSQHRTKCGDKYPVETTSHYVEHGEDEYEFAFTKDMTKREKAERELGERVKELNLLYSLSKVEDSEESLEGILDNAVGLLPDAFQYPEITCAHICLRDDEYKTDNFKETERSLSFDIVVEGEKRGFVEVCYLNERPEGDDGPFLDEEKELLEEFAKKLTLILERKSLDKRLKFQASLLDQVENAVIATDLDGKITYWNEKAEELYGWKEEKALGENIIDISPSLMSKDQAKEIMEKLRNGETWSGEFMVKRKDGTEFPAIVKDSPLYDEKGENIGIVGVTIDITERKKAEEELRESEEKFRSYVENAPIGVFVVDKDGNYLEVNETASEMTGYSKDELLKMNISDLVTSEDRENAAETFEELFETGKMRVELPYSREDGSVRYWILNTVKILEDRYLGFIEDVTNLKESKERKDFLNTLLRQDLGGKYQTIQGYLQLLEADVDLPEDQGEYLEKAIKSGKKVDEILGLAKELNEIERTELKGKKDIIKILNQVIDDISGFLKKKGIEIEENYPKKVGEVKGDYSLNLIFSQILLTRTQISKCNEIKITAEEKEKDVLVRITDDGESLPSDIKKMFSGGVYTGETTGVGGVRYYMLREIARHNKAEIEVKESELGGARFDIYLEKP